MKVLFVEASSGSVVGGSLTGLLHLLRGLDRDRWQPTLVLCEDKPVIEDLRAEGIAVYMVGKRRLPKRHSLQGAGAYEAVRTGVPGAASFGWHLRQLATFVVETLPAAFRLLGLLRRERPDLVQASNGFRGNMDVIVAAWLARIPCVVHAKGFDKLGFLERIFSRTVAAGLCMTRAIEDHCRRAGLRPRRWMVSYDGLALEEFRPVRERGDVRREFGLGEDEEVVGVVGHIQPWKGQKVLLEAAARLAPQRPSLRVMVVGGVHRSGADYAEELRALADDPALAGRVVFTGERADVADLMAAMDVVVHTSVRGEPFGRVIIEAMSVERPVVATRAGGVPEFVSDGVDGLLVAPGDAGELAETLDRVLSDPILATGLSLGAAAKAEYFAVARHVREVTALWEAVLAGGPAPAAEPVPGAVA